MVEYEKWYKMKEDYPMDEVGWHERLKINPKDNTITISKVKDSWTKEEVIDILYKSMDYNITPDTIEGIIEKLID